MRAIFERGIGCDRAVVLDGDRLVEAHIELPGLRVGDVWRVRLVEARGRSGVVELGGRAEVAGLPAGATEGALVSVEIVREPIREPDRERAAKVRVVPEEGGGEGRLRAGPDLRARLVARGLGVIDLHAAAADALEAAGWSEAVEEAASGEIGFAGGRLLIERTAAFEAIDVDGHLPPAGLAVAAAAAVGAAVTRLDLGGPIVIDFPTPGDAAARRAVDRALEAALPRPAERTAMNGFGLVQIVRPKLRPSLMDQMQAEPARAAALALLRRGERAGGAGPLTLTAAPAVLRWVTPGLADELARRTGRAVHLREDTALPIWAGHAG